LRHDGSDGSLVMLCPGEISRAHYAHRLVRIAKLAFVLANGIRGLGQREVYVWISEAAGQNPSKGLRTTVVDAQLT
jgi:hypothetical protein